MSEGEEHHSLHLIVKGRVAVTKAGERMGEYGPHQFAGAMSFLLWQENGGKQFKNDRVTHTLKELEHWNSQSLSADEHGSVREFIDGLREVYRYCKMLWAQSVETPHVESKNHIEPKSATGEAGIKLKAEDEVAAAKKKAVKKGGRGQASVSCIEPCVLYSWSFEDLIEVLQWSATTSAAVESCISADLNSKMLASWSIGPKHMYKHLLSAVLSDREITQGQKKYLDDFRSSHKLSVDDHRTILHELGWTEGEFSAGRHRR